jgi:hypothetical protein
LVSFGFNRDNFGCDAEVAECAFDLVEEVVDQGFRVAKFIRPAGIVGGAMPVIVRDSASLGTPAFLSWPVRVVEADEAGSVGSMQRERIREPVRTPPFGFDNPDVKADPIATLQMVDTAMEGQQELQ